MPLTNDYGFQADETGTLLPGQVTPGMRDNPDGAIQYDPEKDLYFMTKGGQKSYLSPFSYAGTEQAASTAKGTGHGMLQTMSKGGGAFHGHPQWNSQTGHFDVPLDWGKIGSMIVGGLLTAGAVDAAFGAGAATTATSSAATGGLPGAGTTVAGSGAAAGMGGVEGTAVSGVSAGLPGAAATLPAAVGTGAVSRIGNLLRNGGVNEIGKSIGSAVDAAGNNRLNQEKLDLEANGQNNQARSAYETALISRAKLESDQRQQSLKDMYRASYAKNRQSGPFNTRGLAAYSPEYLAGLSDLEKQALLRLHQDPQYGTDKMTPVAPYAPYVPSQTPNAQPSTLQSVGNWLSPAVSTIGTIGRLWGK